MASVVEMFIWSKLGKNLLRMEVRTFARIKKVIWDQLLDTKAEIKKENSMHNIVCVLLFQRLANKHHKLRDSKSS